MRQWKEPWPGRNSRGRSFWWRQERLPGRWQRLLTKRSSDGIVITKYGHVKGPIGHFRLFEAGHPVPDENGFRATEEALQLVSGLTEGDTVLFLLSGGGSALFEVPLIPGAQLQDITNQLLACGAEITETNTIRKRSHRVRVEGQCKRLPPRW